MLQLSPLRLFFYIIVLSALVFLYVFWLNSSHNQEMDQVEARIERLGMESQTRDIKRAANNLVRAYFADADRFYLEKQVQSMELLNDQRHELEKLIQVKSIAEDPRATRRLTALRDNRIVFSEGMVQSYPFFNEIPESLVQPVEVNVDDIRELLAKLEGIKIGPYVPGDRRPQILITEFRLDRKNASREEESYMLNLKLLRREYLQAAP